MSVPLFHIDAFTAEPFRGNPAAVCLLDSPRDEEWMQSVAREMNLAETAFLLPESDGYRIRWFSPEVEVDLCGHATIASTHALAELGQVADGAATTFYSKSGPLTSIRDSGWVTLDFPALPAESVDPPAGLLDALGLDASSVVAVGMSRFDYLVEVESATLVRAIAPDFRALNLIETRGIVVTARSDSQDHDFLSRFFAPTIGIDEDPATGSSHCTLAPYWSAKLGISDLRACQASRRGGRLNVGVRGERVMLSGQAVTVVRGVLT